MAQNAFALFFLAILVGCTAAVTAWVRYHWPKIVAAARGEVLGASRPMTYRSHQRRPIDVPYVAQRMLPQAREATARARVSQPAPSMFRRARPAGHQLGFGF